MRKTIYENINALPFYQHNHFLDFLKSKFSDYEVIGSSTTFGGTEVNPKVFNNLFILLQERGISISYYYRIMDGEKKEVLANVRIELIGEDEKIGEVEKIIKESENS